VPVRRLGYRAAYNGLRLYWFLLRPQSSGIKCVITDGEQVLLVRHTYGPRGWDLPGGSVKRDEEPIDTARREMQEELGVSIEDWRPLGQIEVLIDHRRDRVHCFQAELHGPQFVIDQGELAAAKWFPMDELPQDVGRYTRRILARMEAENAAGG
jgi:8-oxo-dGTP pyrophosphatase MutT (NUDIX family)